MFIRKLKKTASKALAIAMMLTVVSPLTAGNAVAAGPLGNLKVGFNQSDGGFVIRNALNKIVADYDGNDCPLQTSGPYANYHLCQNNLPLGIYSVTFDTVSNEWKTPAPVDVDLNETGKVVLGDYVPQGLPNSGVLGIAINKAEGGYVITNALNAPVLDVNATSCGAAIGGYYHCSQTLPIGLYFVTYKDVPGFDPPAPVNVDLDPGTTNIVGTYTLKGAVTGTLKVRVNLAQGGYTIYDTAQQPRATVSAASQCGAAVGNYYICSQTLPLGIYEVVFNEVSGYKKPSNIDVDLDPIGLTVTGNYTPLGPVTGILKVRVNLAQGGYTVYNAMNQVMTTVNAASHCGAAVNGYYICSQTLPIGIYEVVFKDAPGYNTPSSIDVDLDPIGATVTGFYSIASTPTGVIEVRVVDQNDQPILSLPANEWQLKRCSSADPASCADILASGGPGGVYNNLTFATYRIVFPSPVLPAGYSGRTVIPSLYQVLDANNTSRIFTIKYTKTTQSAGQAYVNVRTTPVMANTRMVTLNPAQPNQQAVTSDLVNAVPTYDLADANRFTLPTLQSGSTAPTNYYIQCLPAPGGYHAPANPIQVNNAVYAKDSENLAGTCQYTQVPDNQKVTITVDTIGIDYAAIYVDGVQVRPTTSNAEVPVVITTTETHVITFEDKDPANFLVPPAITIPANSLNSAMTPDQLRYLGYYVPLGSLAVAEVNTQNQNGWVYLQIGNDPTKWNMGLADTTPTPLIVHFDEAVNHEFDFQDRNAPATPSYFLRAVPVSDPGFSVNETISYDSNGDVTYFQERYTYTAHQALGTVHLTGDYIAYSDAAFFRARTTNAAPVFGEIYLDINNEAPETLIPGAQTWTRVFISDVVNDNDTTRFQSPLTLNSITYTANPPQYQLNTFSPGAAVNDLESTYVPLANAAEILIRTTATNDPDLSAAITLRINGVDYPIGSTVSTDPNQPATLSYVVDATATVTIYYGNVPGYITPAPQPVNVTPGSSWQTNPANIYTGTYVPTGGNNETVTITAWDETGLAILTTVDITVNGTVVSTNGQYSASYPVGAVLNIGFEDVPTHEVPTIEVNGIAAGTSHTTTYTVLVSPSPNTVEAFYPLNGSGNSMTFNVSTRDNLGNALTQNIVHGATGTETTVATPASFTVTQVNLTDYIINFTDRVGYITPGSVTIHNQAIASIPADVTITDNGTAYTAGAPMVVGHTYAIVGTYTPYMAIEKTVTSEQTIVNNNKRVDYRITVTRHPDSPVGAMSITLQDSIAPSRTLTGSNGGTMTVVPQGGAYSTCSNNCGDITTGAVTVPIDNPGNSVTITYQLVSSNAGIPAGSSSNFTNTLTGTFTYNAQQVQLTDTATVNVLAAAAGPGPGPTPTGGGGGGGGGAILIKGDMVLEVTKLVSLDKKKWVDASDEDSPLSIPERVKSTLYTKVNVKNMGQVTATNIRFSEGFDEHDSKISSDKIRNVQGEAGVSYSNTTGIIKIDQLTVGGEINFSYEQTLDEKGSTGQLAEEYLLLEGFGTKLAANQDGLTKHGIGDHYPSWLTAGKGTDTVIGDEGSLLELSIKTDKSAARVGEEVVYTISAKNKADFNLTGMTLTWAYGKDNFEILNSSAGRNTGTEIHWNQGTLRPNQTATYTVRVRVKDTAPVGGSVRTTARGLVNELENPATAEHFLSILAAASPKPIELAQTGVSTLMLILVSLAAYMAYTQTGRRRYLTLKKAALRPL